MRRQPSKWGACQPNSTRASSPCTCSECRAAEAFRRRNRGDAMTKVTRRTAVGLLAGAAISGKTARAQTERAKGETVLRVGMTLADIPVTTSQPNQGGERSEE